MVVALLHVAIIETLVVLHFLLVGFMLEMKLSRMLAGGSGFVFPMERRKKAYVGFIQQTLESLGLTGNADETRRVVRLLYRWTEQRYIRRYICSQASVKSRVVPVCVPVAESKESGKG